MPPISFDVPSHVLKSMDANQVQVQPITGLSTQAQLGSSADVSISDEYQPLLHIAARNGHSQFVLALLLRGVDVNERDEHGGTALLTAIAYQQEDVLRVLLENNADVHAVDDSGWSSLQQAAECGFEAGLTLLLQYGASLPKRQSRARVRT